MARKKISEYTIKKLLYTDLQRDYSGVAITPSSPLQTVLPTLTPEQTYVVKVDEGVKKRFKQGLVALNVPLQNIETELENLKAKGFSHFLLEPYLSHDSSEERYLAFERVREGIKVYVSPHGGVDIEDNQDTVKQLVLTSSLDPQKKVIAEELGITEEVIQRLLLAFDTYYVSFLEINPLVVHNGQSMFLDAAAEVDSAAEFFVRGAWSGADFVRGAQKEVTETENDVEALSEKSQASFSYTSLNPEGNIFMLLSGGGASIVLADEAYNQGYGKSVANYGEYSGNPNAEETYLYTRSVLKALLASPAPRKVLIVGGGVANFTDIRVTFRGVIQALSEVEEALLTQQVKVFVRRGGPNQQEGLAKMREYLEKAGIYGSVEGPEVVLTDVVTQAISYLKEA